MNIVPNQGATLKINDLDAVPIVFRDSEKTNNFIKGAVYDFIYDGTSFNVKQAIPTGTITQGGFEVVDALPTTNLFAGREVFYNGRNYVYNGERWLYPIRFHQIANDTLITEAGWYNIGYYDDNVNLSDYNFDGMLTISSAYSTGRGTSAIIAINSSFNEICITQLSGYRSFVIPQIRIVRDSNIRFILQFQYATTTRNPVNITYTDYRSTNPYRNPFKPLFGKSDIEFDESAIVKVFTLTNGVKTDYNVEGGTIIKTGGTATQMLMADGSTKETSDFLTSTDLPKHTIDGECMIIG